jgi:3-hydroxyacyl-[acyl-carrier-protein] dehydratase
MKLKNNFFQIKNSCQTDKGIDYTITLNPEHAIYQAHFPGNPITPGVCIIQIVKELSEEILEHKLLLKKAKSIKLLNGLYPMKFQEITFSISISLENKVEYKVNALVYNETHQFAKLSMLLINQK